MERSPFTVKVKFHIFNGVYIVTVNILPLMYTIKYNKIKF
jgi:hypothetical protein